MTFTASQLRERSCWTVNRARLVTVTKLMVSHDMSTLNRTEQHSTHTCHTTTLCSFKTSFNLFPFARTPLSLMPLLLTHCTVSNCMSSLVSKQYIRNNYTTDAYRELIITSLDFQYIIRFKTVNTLCYTFSIDPTNVT